MEVITPYIALMYLHNNGANFIVSLRQENTNQHKHIDCFLPACLLICLPIDMYVRVFVSVSVLSIYLSVCASNHLSINNYLFP